MSRKINQKKEAFLASGGLLRSAGLAVPVAGVSSISNFIHQAHHLPAMQQHPGRVRGPHFCMKLRHYKILHSVPAPVFSAIWSGLPAKTLALSPLKIMPHWKTGRRVGCIILGSGPQARSTCAPFFSRSFTPAICHGQYILKRLNLRLL